MKAFRVAIIVAFLISGFLCLSMVSALGSNEATASVRWSNSSPQSGETVTITFNFENKLQKQIQIARIGINCDWMPPDSEGNPRFLGPQYTSNPVTVASMTTFTSESCSVPIPSGTQSGIHTYYIAVDGYDSAGNPFAWDSPQFTITIGGSSNNAASPSPGATNSEPDGPQLDTLTIIAAITITGVIVVIVVTLFMSRRKRQPTPALATPTTDSQPQPPAPKDEPDESQQNFDI